MTRETKMQVFLRNGSQCYELLSLGAIVLFCVVGFCEPRRIDMMFGLNRE